MISNNAVEGYNELFDKKKVKYKKKDIEAAFYIGFLVLLVCAGFASATAPTVPPTISPDNNSVYFNDPTLTCSGSTDAESDPIQYNYTYFVKNSAYRTDISDGWLTYLPGTATFTQGTSLDNFYQLRTSHDNNPAVWTNFTFTCDTFLLYQKGCTETNDPTSIKVYVNNSATLLSSITFDTGDCSTWTLSTLDVSAYTNGNYKVIFLLDVDGSSSWSHFRWWFDNINTQAFPYEDSLTSITPSLDSGENYFWKCRACDNNTECSSYTDTRDLSQMSFDNCASGNVALNFTIRDEENEAMLIGDLDGTLTLDNAFDSRSYPFGLSGNSNYKFCLNPTDINVDVTGFMEYLPDSADYTFPRQYYLDGATINGNNTQSINLYSLLDSLSTAVVFTASRAGSLASDILIHLQRYDPATNVFRLVATGLTSSSGTDVIYLRLTDAWYKIIAYEDGELVFTSDPSHLTSTTYLMNLIGATPGEEALNQFGEWLDMGNIIFTLNYSTTSEAFQLVADDSTGAATSMCLKVDQYDMLNGTANICYQCVETASVSLSCAITNTDAYYTAQFIGYTNSSWRVLGSLTVDLTGKIAEIIGKDGTFYAFLIVGVSAFAAIWSPAAAITLTLFSLTAMSVLGFIDVSWGIIMLLIVTGMALLTVMYKRRTM